MKKFIFTLVLVFSSICLASFQLSSVSGRAFSDIYVPTQNRYPSKPFQQLSASLWLEEAPQFDDFTSKFIYQGDGFDGQNSSSTGQSQVSHWESRLREGYVDYTKGGWTIRGGQQVISWGKSDAINPTDFHTAKNFTFFNPDEETRRIGSLSLMAIYTPNGGVSPFSFTGVFTPLFAQSKLLFPPSLVPSTVTINDPQTPPVTFENSEGALKASYAGMGWDFSLSGFAGYSHMPELQLSTYALVGQGAIGSLSQVFRKIWAVGMDGSYSTEKWIFRGESAFIQTPNADGTNPLIEPSHWDTVIGAERSLGGSFRIQGQLLVRYFPRYTSPDQATGPDPATTQIDKIIAASNALLLQYQDPARPGATLRLAYVDEKTGWDGEIFFLQNFNGGDYLLRPEVTYAWTDFLKSSVGAELYEGPSNRPLGALNPYSSIFLEVKYTF